MLLPQFLGSVYKMKYLKNIYEDFALILMLL